MINFESFPLPESLRKSLAKMNFTSPTPIQAESIPVATQGKDISGSSQTGSGKTAAFSIPLVARLTLNPNENAIVITPTRELALQVLSVIEQLDNNLRRVLLIGGEPMFKQINQLRKNPRIVVGTPGRINDHIKRGLLNLSNTKYLVLDETDRMLDIGMGEQIEQIVKHLPSERQTLLFSATLSPNIIKVSQKYLNNPVRISIGNANTVTTNIKQESMFVDGGNKYRELLNQLQTRNGSVIIFVKTKISADKLASKLGQDNHAAAAIHGDLHQRKREKVINSFRNKAYRVLVATDVAARGLDIPHIEHVINFDLPQCPEDYIHRIGRTARGGAEGSALSFISNDDKSKWRAITRLLDPNASQTESGNFSDDDTRRNNFSKRRGFSSRNKRFGGNGGSSSRFNRDGGDRREQRDGRDTRDFRDSRSGESRGNYSSEGRGNYNSENRGNYSSENRNSRSSNRRRDFRNNDYRVA